MSRRTSRSRSWTLHSRKVNFMYISFPIPWSHIHPVLVHFTTALLPVSFVSDLVGRYAKLESLVHAAWWMLLYGALATPLTALAGLIWSVSMGDADPLMSTHKWLGL